MPALLARTRKKMRARFKGVMCIQIMKRKNKIAIFVVVLVALVVALPFIEDGLSCLAIMAIALQIESKA